MKRYLNDNFRDDAHQYPYTFQEIRARFTRGTLWNRREYELGDGVADKLKEYFTYAPGLNCQDTGDEFTVTDPDTRDTIIITDYYLYTE